MCVPPPPSAPCPLRAQVRFCRWGGEIRDSAVVAEGELRWLVARAVQVEERSEAQAVADTRQRLMALQVGPRGPGGGGRGGGGRLAWLTRGSEARAALKGKAMAPRHMTLLGPDHPAGCKVV